MKKALLFLFMTVFALSFNSCSSDDDNSGSDKKNIVISTSIRMKGDENTNVHDVGAKVYVFRGTEYGNTNNYEYKGSGKFYNKTTGGWSEFVSNYTIGSMINLTIESDYDCTVVVESAFYPGEYIVKTKKYEETDRTLNFVFYPVL